MISDPRTGEVLDDEQQIRPFAELLHVLDRGAAHAEASRALHDLVAAVADTGKVGTMTLTVKLAPLKGSTEQIMVEARVASKPPKSDPGAALFWRDRSGNLVRNDPNQPEIDGIRVVEPKPARVVGGTEK